MDFYLILNQINELLELAGLQKIKMVAEMPHLTFVTQSSTQSSISSFKEIFYICGVLYILDCICISPKCISYFAGVSIGMKHTYLPNVIYYKNKKMKECFELMLYLSYCFQTMDIHSEKIFARIIDEYNLTSTWKNLLVEQALGQQNYAVNQYSNCSGDCFEYVVQKNIQVNRSVFITYDNNIIVKLINVEQNITVFQCLMLIKQRIHLHRFNEETYVTQIIEKINGMLTARLRFITFCDVMHYPSMLFDAIFNEPMQHALSFGQLVSFTNDKWQDPDVEIKYYITVDAIRQIIWNYMVDINSHRKLLDSKLSFQDGYAKIVRLFYKITMETICCRNLFLKFVHSVKL